MRRVFCWAERREGDEIIPTLQPQRSWCDLKTLDDFAKEEKEQRDRVKQIIADAPSAIADAKKNSPSDLNARAECAKGDGKACTRATRFVKSFDEYMALLADHCRVSPGMCTHLTIAARGAKNWELHRRGVEGWVKHAPAMSATLVRFHVKSPEWPSEWAWKDEGRDPKLGRELALKSCNQEFIGLVSDVACPELLNAAREGVGGPKGETDAERLVLDDACYRGGLPENMCATRGQPNKVATSAR